MDHLKVALLGGTFNPIHNGHLKIAKHMLDYFNFDEVWLLLAKAAPLKDASEVAYDDRKAMMLLMLADYPNIKLCEIEAELPTPSYTIHTIEALQARYPHEFAFVIGSDQAQQFHLWKAYETLLEKVTFYEVGRNGSFSDWETFVRVDALSSTSSTAIRQGQSNDTNPKVLKYMIMHHLYDASILRQHMQPKRLAHSQRVCETAMDIAKHHYLDLDVVQVAAMYHDVAKAWGINDAFCYLRKHSDVGDLPKHLWHPYWGSQLLKHYYHVDNRDILLAIRHHVNGSDASSISQIIYIADKIEPGRGYDSEPLLALAKTNLKQAFERVQDENKQYILKQGDRK